MDGFVKVEGFKYSETCRAIFKVLSDFNQKREAYLIAQRDAKFEADQAHHRLMNKKYDADRVIALKYFMAGHYRTDFNIVISKYTKEVVTRSGFWFIKRISERKIDWDLVKANIEDVKAKLISIEPIYWTRVFESDKAQRYIRFSTPSFVDFLSAWFDAIFPVNTFNLKKFDIEDVYNYGGYRWPVISFHNLNIVEKYTRILSSECFVPMSEYNIINDLCLKYHDVIVGKLTVENFDDPRPMG